MSFSNSSKVIALSLGVLVMVLMAGYLVFAWTGAPGTPSTCPSGWPGCDAPINVSATTQTKAGGLNILGNVGIGTASPGQRLTVSGSGAGIASFNDGAGPCCASYYTMSINESGSNQPTLQFHDSGISEGQIILSSALGGRAFKFQSVQTSMNGWFTGGLQVDGKVGIGTASPGAKLHTYESTALGGTAGNPQIIERISGNVAGGNTFMNNLWLYRDAAGSSWATARLHDAISIDTSFLTPGTDTKTWWERDPAGNIQSWGNAASTYMTINAGNVGIGTIDPGAYKLNVAGDANAIRLCIAGNCQSSWPSGADSDWIISGTNMYSGVSGNVGIGTASPYGKLDVVETGTNVRAIKAGAVGDAVRGMFLVPNLGGGGYNPLSQAGDLGLFFTEGTGGTGNLVIAPWSSATAGVRITSSGNVGIGTATPGVKLDVAGSIRAGNIDAGRTGDLGGAGGPDKDFSVTFNKTFPSVPAVTCTVEEGTDYKDRFGCTIRTISTTGFTGYIWRAAETSWGQNGVWVNWIAISP